MGHCQAPELLSVGATIKTGDLMAGLFFQYECVVILERYQFYKNLKNCQLRASSSK